MTMCPKCGRPSVCGSVECYDIEHCHGPGRNACRCVAAAYRRGAEAMREACIAEAVKLGIYPGMAREIFGRIDVDVAMQAKGVRR